MKRHKPTLIALASLCFVVAMGLAGCSKTVVRRPDAPPPPTYTGPDFLKTTIGSMTNVAGYRPTVVSGIGLVHNLNGTGSGSVPPSIRQWMLNDMARHGIGRGDYADLSPMRMLNSRNTTVVMVEGIIPPGATKGTRFDIVVTPLPQDNETSSLVGGKLYTTELRIGTLSPGRPTSHPLAVGRGELFINPFVQIDPDAVLSGSGGSRVGRVIGGGIVTRDRPLNFVLNQPSYRRCRDIADRLNNKFEHMQPDKFPMAVAKNDQAIAINVPTRHKADPTRLLELASHLYMNPTIDFNRATAQMLLERLEEKENQRHVSRIVLAWEGMGRSVLPLLREHYEHADPVVRLAALETGARLGDPKTAEPLYRIAKEARAGTGERATAYLGALLATRVDDFRLAIQLRDLLDSDDVLVRLTACDALSRVGDASVKVRSFGEKLDLLLVQSSKPMIYVTRQDAPRIVIFDDMLSFRRPTLFVHSQLELMLRYNEDEQFAAVRYRDAKRTRGETDRIAPTVANLVLLLAHEPNHMDTMHGYNLSYSQVVRTLYELEKQGHIKAPVVLQPTDLTRRLTQRKRQDIPRTETGAPGGRPETEGAAPRD